MSTSTPTTAKPKKRSYLLWKVLFSIFFGLIFLELLLRIQQKLGPWFDLEMNGVHPGIISDELNHRPEHLDTWPYDENGVIQYSEDRIPAAARNDPKAFKILFMGDSFMQAFGGKQEIPWQVWSHFQAAGVPMVPFNAGFYSYAPSIFTVQARKLLPIVKPDAVVIVIDNTDMGDDAFRYRNLIVRNEQGKIIAVKHTPGYSYFIQGFLDARQHWLYITRFVHKLYHTRIGYPRVDQGKSTAISDQICASITDQSPDVDQKYKEAVTLFEANLRDLADVLIEHVGSGKQVLWVCHPNPFHLKASPEKPAPNQLVFKAVEKIAREKGLHYYNATDDLRRALAPDFEKYYMKGDPVYHFIPEGCIIYARQIYDHLPEEWKKGKK